MAPSGIWRKIANMSFGTRRDMDALKLEENLCENTEKAPKSAQNLLNRVNIIS